MHLLDDASQYGVYKEGSIFNVHTSLVFAFRDRFIYLIITAAWNGAEFLPSESFARHYITHLVHSAPRISPSTYSTIS